MLDYDGNPAVFGVEPEPTLIEFLPRDVGRALDVGCGQGRNALALGRRGWSVTGLEPSHVAAEQVRSAARLEGLDVSVVECPFALYEAGGFEVVLVYGLIPLLLPSEIDTLMDRLSRWLVPDGLAFVTAFTDRDPSRERFENDCASGEHRTFLAPGDLRRLFDGWTLVHDREDWGPVHRHGDGALHRHHVAAIVARR